MTLRTAEPLPSASSSVVSTGAVRTMVTVICASAASLTVSERAQTVKLTVLRSSSRLSSVVSEMMSSTVTLRSSPT